MNKYRIVLTDDHKIFRTGLRSLIDKETMLTVVGEASDGKELLRKLRTLKCDLVVLDISMPNMDGIAAMKTIRDKFPSVKILVLTMQKDPQHFKHAMRNGASGYMLKEDAYEQLAMAIKMIVKKGKQFVSPSVAALLTDRYIRSLDETETPLLGNLNPPGTTDLEVYRRGFGQQEYRR